MKLDRRLITAQRFVRLQPNAGFTLVEMICVVTILGVLAAIVAPGWLGFSSNRDLTAAQDRIYQVIATTQRQAKLRRVPQEIQFQQSGSVQWATRSGNGAISGWQGLQSGIQIDTSNTTLSQSGSIYRIQFDAQGNITGQLGRLTLSHPNGGNAKRCVLMSTLLGALRRAQDAGCE